MRGENGFHGNASLKDHHIEQAARNDLARLLKKGLNSDRFKIFEAIAQGVPNPVEAATSTEGALRGSLTHTRSYKMTEYGRNH